MTKGKYFVIFDLRERGKKGRKDQIILPTTHKKRSIIKRINNLHKIISH